MSDAAATLSADPGALAVIDHNVDKILGCDDGRVLGDLEDMRQKYLFWFYIGLIFTVTAAVVGYYVVAAHWRAHPGDFKGNKDFSNFITFFCVLILVAALSPTQIYKNKARQILMPSLVKLFGDLSWSPQKLSDDHGLWQDIRNSQLTGFYDNATVKDFITGSVGKIPVTMAETTLTRGSGKSRTIVFMGAAIAIHLQKSAPLWLMLKLHQVDLHLFPGASAGNEVGIPSPDFIRNFSAYSNDQVLARTLLTPDVVEQITKLALAFGNRCLSIGLRGDCLLLMAHGKGELAPESLFTSAYKLDHVHAVGRQLYLLSTLIETIMKDWRLDSVTPYQPAQQI